MMMAGYEKTLLLVKPGDPLTGDCKQPPTENDARHKHSSARPSTSWRHLYVAIATLIILLYAVTSWLPNIHPLTGEFLSRVNVSSITSSDCIQRSSLLAVFILCLFPFLVLLQRFELSVFGNGCTHAWKDEGVKALEFKQASAVHSTAEAHDENLNCVSDSSDNSTQRNVEVWKVENKYEILIENFTSSESRRAFEQRVRRCLKSFMICFMPPYKVEVILSHDCGLDVSNVDVEQLKKELCVSPQINIELLALAEESRFDQSADIVVVVDTVVPGDDVSGKCACSMRSLTSTITLFLVDRTTGYHYLISTGHGRSAGDELSQGSRTQFATVMFANFLKNDGLPTVDVALARIHNIAGASVLNNQVTINGRLVALSQRVESSESPDGKRVQKFCEGSDGRKGIVRSRMTRDKSFQDCLEVISVDDGNPFHGAGESGTLLVVELPDSDQAAAAGTPVEACGFGVLIGLLTSKLTNGTSRISSIAAPLDRTLMHITSHEEFSWLEIMKTDEDTALKVVYGNVERSVSQNTFSTDRFHRMQLIERDQVQSMISEMAVDLQTQHRSSMRALKRDVHNLRQLVIKQRTETQEMRREIKNKDRRILILRRQLRSNEKKAVSQNEELLRDNAKLMADFSRKLQKQKELIVQLIHGFVGKKSGPPASESCLLSNAELCTHQPNLQTIEPLHQMVVDGSQPRINVASSWVSESKIINDVIHGNVELHPLLVAIIDTPQFQRLRNIKQWPGAYFVFSGAAHNRFEHSIGVAYLAGKLVKRLATEQKELRINNSDILCVQIAGLCVDLGIGPLSHVYGRHFIGRDWKHEDMSLKMFDNMVLTNNLREQFTKYSLTEQDMIFIREQIGGLQLSDGTPDGDSGRNLNKQFLYQVVGERQSGLDVDAWDCYLRDAYHLQIKTAFDHRRLIKFTRVSRVLGSNKRIICIRDKEVDTLYSEFTTRLMHNRNAIQHKVAIAVETMLVDAMKLADDYIEIKGSDCQKFTLSTAFQDVVAFSKLDDNIYHRIRYSRRPELAKARKILENIEHRQLYLLVDECKPTIGADTRPILADETTKRLTEMLKEDIAVVHVSSFDYGKATGQNPVDDLHYFTKQCAANALPSSRHGDCLMRPARCREYIIRIYCKRRDHKTIEEVRRCSRRVMQELGMSRSTQQEHSQHHVSVSMAVECCTDSINKKEC